MRCYTGHIENKSGFHCFPAASRTKIRKTGTEGHKIHILLRSRLSSYARVCRNGIYINIASGSLRSASGTVNNVHFSDCRLPCLRNHVFHVGKTARKLISFLPRQINQFIQLPRNLFISPRLSATPLIRSGNKTFPVNEFNGTQGEIRGRLLRGNGVNCFIFLSGQSCFRADLIYVVIIVTFVTHFCWYHHVE